MNWRRLIFALSLLALVSKFMIPAGYMPGATIAAPIILCSDGGPAVPMMMDAGHAGHGKPSKALHKGAGLSCDFAGVGATALLSPPELVGDVLIWFGIGQTLLHKVHGVPGGGMPAPPPLFRA